MTKGEKVAQWLAWQNKHYDEGIGRLTQMSDVEFDQLFNDIPEGYCDKCGLESETLHEEFGCPND